jgi:arsenate reductase
MAEGFLRHWGADRFEALSAGTKPAAEVHPLAQTVMLETGIDISHQRPKHVSEYIGGRGIDYLITVCGSADAECPASQVGVGQRLHWPFDDPAAFTGSGVARLEGFRRVRDAIAQRVKAWLGAKQFPKASALNACPH